MKIFVYSKKELKNQYYINKKWFCDPNKYFISISGMMDDCKYPCEFLSHNSKRVLHLLFDDVTEIESDSSNIILFDIEHANKIFDFSKSIPENATLYINCSAGISRSGAVGCVLNEYLNSDNKEDYLSFYDINSQIQPNPYVKKILSDVVFGQKNYYEIFKQR